MEIGINSMFMAIINVGGDTDTNAAIAGQITGALVGLNGIKKPDFISPVS